jgi:apolipoprotein N-acyltransferase
MVDTDQAVVYTGNMMIVLLLIVLFPGVAVTLGIPMAIYGWAAYRSLNKPAMSAEALQEHRSKRLGALLMVGIIVCMVASVWISHTDFYELIK